MEGEVDCPGGSQDILNGVDTVILYPGGDRKHLQGGDWFLSVNLHGPKYVSQCMDVSSVTS